MASVSHLPSTLEAIARKIANASDAEGVVLFGSRARGDARVESDVDLALVFRNADGMREGIRRAHRALWPREFPVDLVPITFAALRQGNTALAREISMTGVVLYGRVAA